MAGSIHKRYRGWIQAILLLLILAFGAWRLAHIIGDPAETCEFPSRVPSSELIYVDHARCRMACRDISQALVERVYQEGELNCKKSSQVKGHPRFALELRDDRGDMIRLIIEEDEGQHVVITAIRLDKPDKCACS